MIGDDPSPNWNENASKRNVSDSVKGKYPLSDEKGQHQSDGEKELSDEAEAPQEKDWESLRFQTKKDCGPGRRCQFEQKKHEQEKKKNEKRPEGELEKKTNGKLVGETEPDSED